MNIRHRRRKATRVAILVAAGLLLPVAGRAATEPITISHTGKTKSEACEGVRKDAHVWMGGPRQGGRLPSYCGDCVREVVTKAGNVEEWWTCTVTVEIFND